ncbi:DUF4041 domain-containing protein [Empedobacter sp. GD03644]|nr:DUF4041 domain-containing protein [Empedobacter sp. GD03644]MDH2208706.1 DUF4041 domain-containing protein [Empedobacter sp. GD03644]
MGIFDFLKKKEFDKISELEKKIISLENTNSELNSNLTRYNGIVDVEFYIKTEKEKFDALDTEVNNQLVSKKNDLDELNNKYLNSLDVYKDLKSKISIYENQLDLAEFGLYEPLFDFEKSDQYRYEQSSIRDRQKHLITVNRACVCDTTWTIDGSEAKGRAATNKYIKLLLRAFNGECDALLGKVKWNNINQIKERIKKSFTALNKLGEGQHVRITNDYLELKLKEIILEYEFQLKKQQEKEEAKAIQDELREEEKAKREFEKAQKDAEKEEAYFQKALEKVRKEQGTNNSEELKLQIEQLEKELEEARLKKERALSMAQQTKRGHVYIISNIGSFGENVFKIGMTRRLEPLDRVRELGDASVPFRFDVHAMIYSDEARTLEYELHKAFADKAVNLFNYRREFFNVTLQEIKEKIVELGFEAEFITDAEAMEYRESLLLKEQSTIEPIEMIEEEFPTSLM